MPSRMLVDLVYVMNFWLNAFTAAEGVSSAMSPREIVSGVGITAGKHCVIPYGAYAQVHENHDNSMDSRTIGAIALRPTGNAQRGHYFYSLESGRRINRNRWTELPMPDHVIARVQRMAESAVLNRLMFGDRNNEECEEGGAAQEISSDSGSESGSETGGSDTDEHGRDEVAEFRSAENPEALGHYAAADQEGSPDSWHGLDEDGGGEQRLAIKQRMRSGVQAPNRRKEKRAA